MKRFSVLASITATLLLGSVAGHAQSPEIRKFFVFDAHMHPMANAYRGGWNVGEANDPQFSLSMARQGGLGAVFANTSVDEFYSVNHIAVKEVLRQFDHMYRQVVLYPDQLGIARDADQVRALQKEGKLAIILSISGGSALESDLAALRMLHELGLRLISPMHFFKNSIGDIAISKENNGKGGGLTPFGRELVAEMNRLGIVIDLAHASEQTSRDIIEASTHPVINSHVGVEALVDAPLNWNDAMLRLLGESGGLIGIPFIPQVISPEFHKKWPPRRTANPSSRITETDPMEYMGDPAKIYDFIREKTQGSGSGRLERARRQRADLPPLSEYVKHIDHVVNLVGIDHVCISTDWGATVVSAQGIENAAEFQNVAQALLDSGYSEEDVAKIMGENLLRVFDEVMKTAPKLTD
ncbi:MAG: membrane dipeptidase [Acidobacteria bacterium]|nr:MAG: membrane dipeptidase [Acidobacteriota bacterium]